MDTFVNQIKLDWATELLDALEYQVTTEPVQSSEFSDIARHVRNIPQSFSIRGAFKNDDRKSKYNNLKALADKKELVTFRQAETTEDLIITSIKETQKATNVIIFEITFQPVRVVKFEVIPIPKIARKPRLRKAKKRGKQKVQEKNISTEKKVVDQNTLKVYKPPTNIEGVGGVAWSV